MTLSWIGVLVGGLLFFAGAALLIAGDSELHGPLTAATCHVRGMYAVERGCNVWLMHFPWSGYLNVTYERSHIRTSVCKRILCGTSRQDVQQSLQDWARTLNPTFNCWVDGSGHFQFQNPRLLMRLSIAGVVIWVLLLVGIVGTCAWLCQCCNCCLRKRTSSNV